MDVRPQSTPGMEKLAELIADVEVAMLVTVEADGALRSRPLVTLQMDGDGGLWFFTSISSDKVGEIDGHRRVGLSYSRPGHRNYVSVSGITQIIRDEEKARELWTPALLAFFPDGVDDPDLVLLKVTVQDAEYWDLPSGQMSRLFGGERPRHDKVHAPGMPRH